MLNCGRLPSSEQVFLNRHDMVMLENAWHEGQGLFPMTWQMLEDAKSIPVALFEPVTHLDAGAIYLLLQIDLQDHELMEEWRAVQC